ncbi:MAG: hypothetical protein AAFW89_11545 [Bacteroidota bacterium]
MSVDLTAVLEHQGELTPEDFKPHIGKVVSIKKLDGDELTQITLTKVELGHKMPSKIESIRQQQFKVLFEGMQGVGAFEGLVQVGMDSTTLVLYLKP